MALANTAKPATDLISEPASNFERLGGKLRNSDTSHRSEFQAATIRCELTGSDTATARGLTASGSLALCRALLEAGVSPDAPLECFRESTLALRIRSVRAGAGLKVRETDTDGQRVVAWTAFAARRVPPPVRQIGGPVLAHLPQANERRRA
jgi:hypothetical protein